MASCATSRWKAAAPQMKLTVTQGSSTSSTVNLEWTLEFIGSSPAKTSGGNTWNVSIDGQEVDSGSYNINGKVGTYTVARGSTSVSKGSDKSSIEFSVYVMWGITWSGVYCGSKTATGSIAIEAGSSSSSGSGSGSGSGSSDEPRETYTVREGDTLTKIARKFNTTVADLVELNDITDPDYIVVGQVLIISGGKDTSSNSTGLTAPTIKTFGLQSNTDRTIYVTWNWLRDNTENYRVVWYYDTGDGVWFVGSDTTSEFKQSTYNAPTNAERVKVKVKPVSKKHTVNDKETSYWSAEWSETKIYDFDDNPPVKPDEPTVKIEKYTLTAELDDLDVNAEGIEFQVVKNNETVFATGKATIITNHASYSCTVEAGGEYKVRCRSYRGDKHSDWSGYSDKKITVPAAPTSITTCRASSETSVVIEWTSAATATSYDIEYTTKKEYFDGSDQTQTVNGVEYTHYEKTGLESGEEYFFRVRAVNSNGHSAWSEIRSVVVGKTPAAPTTWSSTTTVIVGENLTLYWVHNAEDGSSQTYAELELYINGLKETFTIKNSALEDEKDKTSSYVIDTTAYQEGVKIQWRVRTAGVTLNYGDWSVQRTIDIYAPSTLELRVTDVDENAIETLTTFPFYVYALAGPKTQTPIGYHLTVTANEIYETVDSVGNVKMVNKGEEVYAKYFDISDTLLVEMSAHNLDLENGIHYTVTCVVTMDSGLTATASREFAVSWTDVRRAPNAEIGIDFNAYTAYIRPYCEDEDGNLVDNVFLAVYRREFDGSFVELASGIENIQNTFITDPHPALDYARYRIVATTEPTGTVSYYDVPGYPVGGKSVIIQWAEEWSSFDVSTEDAMEQPAWSGSLLKLPYNIDIADDHKPDVEFVEYIGRSRPVSYYGTQLGSTATWNMAIPKNDVETLYALRRLAKWMGDVYVREPSGSGYWANITVSFSQKHRDVIIPVTLNIVRVEGGV